MNILYYKNQYNAVTPRVLVGYVLLFSFLCKKSLKMPKGKSKRDNTMSKRKRTKGQTTSPNIHIKLKI
jgi:hypothetical protein